MAEYIEREAVMKIIDDYGCTHGGTLGSHSGAVDVVGSAIYKLPAADVVPVKHGHWIEQENWVPDDYYYTCSVCGEDYNTIDGSPDYNYCPNCGARMDGGDNE